MASSGIANQFWQHGFQIALSIATYVISINMFVFGASVQKTKLEIMSLLTSNTPAGITTDLEHSAMPTARQPMPNSNRAIFTKDSWGFDKFSVS
jgi:hypothetical protein